MFMPFRRGEVALYVSETISCKRPLRDLTHSELTQDYDNKGNVSCHHIQQMLFGCGEDEVA